MNAEERLKARKEKAKENKRIRLAAEAEEARQVANQIVPTTVPQNQQLIQHVPAAVVTQRTPSPNPMMGMSPAAQAVGQYFSSPEDNYHDDIDLSEYADLLGMAIAPSAQVEARLIAPVNATAQLDIDSTGRVSGTTIIPAQFTGGGAPRVITNAVYQSRVYGRHPLSFLPTKANIPYDPYFNRTLWYQLNDSRWVFEMDPTKHPDYEALQAAKANEARYNEGTISAKELEKRAINKLGPGMKALIQGSKRQRDIVKDTGKWDSIKTKAYRDAKKDNKDGPAFTLARRGNTPPPNLPPPTRTFAAPPGPYRSQISNIMNQVEHHPVVQQVVNALNPTGLEMAPEGSQANDFPDSRTQGNRTLIDNRNGGETQPDEAASRYTSQMRRDAYRYERHLFEQVFGPIANLPLGAPSEWDEPFIPPTPNKKK